MNVIKGKIVPIRDGVIVTDMNFDEQKTASGIIIKSDDGKSEGVKPRWGRVWAIGKDQKDVKIGEWILIEHGRWTRKIKIDDGDSVKEVQKVEVASILAVTDDKPTDINLGREFSDGDSLNIRPEDFGAR